MDTGPTSGTRVRVQVDRSAEVGNKTKIIYKIPKYVKKNQRKNIQKDTSSNNWQGDRVAEGGNKILAAGNPTLYNIEIKKNI